MEWTLPRWYMFHCWHNFLLYKIVSPRENSHKIPKRIQCSVEQIEKSSLKFNMCCNLYIIMSFIRMKRRRKFDWNYVYVFTGVCAQKFSDNSSCEGSPVCYAESCVRVRSHQGKHINIVYIDLEFEQLTNQKLFCI